MGEERHEQGQARFFREVVAWKGQWLALGLQGEGRQWLAWEGPGKQSLPCEVGP